MLSDTTAALETVAVTAEPLTDLELRSLIDVYEGMATDALLSGSMRAWYRALAGSLRHVAGSRTWSWLDLTEHMRSTMRLPPDWDTCVALLPEAGEAR
jgi:hypothetical protein